MIRSAGCRKNDAKAFPWRGRCPSSQTGADEVYAARRTRVDASSVIRLAGGSASDSFPSGGSPVSILPHRLSSFEPLVYRGGQDTKKQAPTGVSACKQALQRLLNCGARRAALRPYFIKHQASDPLILQAFLKVSEKLTPKLTRNFSRRFNHRQPYY